MKDGELDYFRRSGKLDYLDKAKLLDSMDDIASNSREISDKLDDMVSNGRDISDNLNDIADDILSTGREVSDKLDNIHNVISYSYADLKAFYKYSHAKNMWMQEKQLDKLTGIYEGIKKSRTNEANELFDLATTSLDRGMIKESLRLLKLAIELNPLDYRVYMTMGYIYLMSNKLGNAFDMYELAFRNVQEPKYQSFTLLQMANVSSLAGDKNEAVKLSEKAVKLTPNDPKVRFQYVLYEAQNI